MRKLRRKSLFIAVDIGIVWVSIFLAYYFRFFTSIPSTYFYQFILFGLFASIACIALNIIFKLYNRAWRYASIEDMLSILTVITWGSVISYFLTYFATDKLIPMSVFLLSFETMLLLSGGLRFGWRVYRSIRGKRLTSTQPALIIGAGDCGILIVNELKHNMNSTFRPIGFIDDDPNKLMEMICGIRVLGNRHQIPKICEQYDIRDIIIAMPSASKREVSMIIDICKTTKARLKIIPSLDNLISGKVTVNEIRDVDVEDLLGREPVRVQLDELAQYLADEVVMVTGAGGSIGSELCRQIAPLKPKSLILLGNSENEIFDMANELTANYPKIRLSTVIADVKDSERIESVFSKHRPKIVFHAAAHKHVPLMEENPDEAIKNNVFGTKNVADYAHRFGATKFVLISTDKAVNPTSVMGTTKRIAEMYLQGLSKISDTEFCVVRFGNVLGSRGSVIPKFKRQIAEGGPVTVTHKDMIRYFMTIPEAVQLIIQAGVYSKGGEVFVLDMGEPVRIVQLAEDMIRLSGFEPYRDIDIVFTGIRPGEKLYEELLTQEEGLVSTRNDRIFVSHTQETDYETISNDLDTLAKLTGASPIVIKRCLKSVVPSYTFEESDATAVS